jgi:NAD-dependent dihydropyrimidine dehydrogenase PreA subunit
MRLAGLLPTDKHRLTLLSRAVVTATPGRCVQCGICSYNCPAGIDVRARARQGEPVLDPSCLRCGACVARCPRGTLQLSELDGAA